MPRNFPDGFIPAYLAHQRVSETPEIAHFWSAVWAVAGALRRNVWYEAGSFVWTPNFYIVLVGPPGVIQKSTTAGRAKRLLSAVPGVLFGPDSATWHGLIPKFNAAEQQCSIDGKSWKISPLSMAVSELGSFLKLSQEGLDSVLIDMWDGQLSSHPWMHTTQSHGDKLIWNGLLNLLGCTTLGWIRQNIPASAMETGVISRILFVYADSKREVISIPKLDSRWNPAAQTGGTAALIADLKEIALLRGPLELSPAAYAWQNSWYHELWKARPAHMASERFDVYRSRKQSHVLKLAIVLACSKGDSMVIEQSTFQEAVKVVDETEAGMLRIFETIGGPEEAQHVREVVQQVRGIFAAGGKPVSLAELYGRLAVVLSYDEIGTAVRVAQQTGQIQSVKPATGAAGLVPVEQPLKAAL